MSGPADTRSQRAEHLRTLLGRIPGYLPGPGMVEGLAGSSLLHVAARYLERLDEDRFRALDGALLAFLDSLGERRLPAQAAEAPVVFQLGDSAGADVGVAPGTQIQAQPPVPGEHPPPMFSTVEPFTITRASLVHVYSVSPGDDSYADHSERVTSGFVAFEDMVPIEHSVYLGDDLFDLPRVGGGSRDEKDAPVPETILHLRFDFHKLLERQAGEDEEADEEPVLKVRWEYHGETGWMPLEEQTSEGRPEHSLFGQEIVVLKKSFGPASKKLTLEGHETYWIRGRLIARLPSESVDKRDKLPVVDRVFVTVESTLDKLRPDQAFAAGLTLDISQPFFPFGRVPRTHDAFYVACREALQRKHTLIRARIIVTGGLDLTKGYTWEYFDGVTYRHLEVVRAADEYRFRRPFDWQESEVDGSSNFWLRIRVIADDGGNPVTVSVPPPVTFSVEQTVTETETGAQTIEGTLTVDPPPTAPTIAPTITPPIIEEITFSFFHLSPSEAVRYGVTSNDFIHQDVSAQLRYPGRTFQPFRREGSPRDALYLAFDAALPPALVSLYVHIEADVAEPGRGLRFVWEYWQRDRWRPLSVRDRTGGLRESGTIQFVGPWDATPCPGLGDRSLYRIRARLKEGASAVPAPVQAIWLNAVLARDERVFPRMPLGESNGNARQTFRVADAQLPILAGERVEIREWSRSTGGPPPFGEDLPDGHYERTLDPTTGALDQIWVRWSERPSLLESDPDSRHYTIDRTSGRVRFGDGRRGRIPPPGATLRISHRSGGGAHGNVPAQTIRAVRTAIAGLDRVTNPLPALGGAASEPLQETARRGPQRLRHGDRAITETDYTWLAREASPAVARARCLPLTGAGGSGQRGWVTVIIIPHSTDPEPVPDPTLRRRVAAFLAARAPAAMARRILVEPPTYSAVTVCAAIRPTPDADLTSLEASLRVALDRFLHPLMGGSRNEGWPVGAHIYLSQIAQLVEAHPGVDQALELRLLVGGAEQGQVAMVPQHTLPSAGLHELSFAFEEPC